MFAWMGGQIDGLLGNYVLSVVSSLMTALTPVALAAMTVWIIMYGWAVMRGEASEPLNSFVWKVFKIGLVLSIALQAGTYIRAVSETANSLAMGVANTFLPAGTDPTTISSPYALLDKFNDNASSQVSEIMKEASMFRLDLLLAAAIFSIGSVLFLCIALFVVTLSKLFLTFVLAIGPLFVFSLAWRPTARFFDSWLSMLLNAVVLTWFAFFALGISGFMGDSMFRAIQDGGGFLEGSFNVLGESMRYCVVMVLMAIICFQAPSLASALTGGAAVQQGVQMIQNVMMVSGLRSGAAARSSAHPSAAGGAIHAGTGAAYAAGRATSAAGTAAASSARRGFQAARTAAYKVAAQRGRS